MNLNPLKKEDNTEALVKALEDANGTGQTVAADTPGDNTASTALGSDAAQVAADGAGVPAATDTPANDQSAAADPAAGLTFSGNDLPAGLSNDADAAADTTPGTQADSGEIDSVKKSALEQLRPLIEKLDLEPNDKFDKYLMMLRASDDPALIKPAFDAAQGITGEKEKAQALLDIINEINYISASQQASTT